MTSDPNSSSNRHCRLCGSADLFVLIDFGKQPIAHRFLTSRDQAEFTHPLTLHFCNDCGLAQILDPIDPELLYRGYNYCFSAWKPEPHREMELAMISAHKPQGKVFEIGCNDGLFLEQLQKRGHKLCVGLEPNPFARKYAVESRGLSVYETFLNEATCREVVAKYGKFDIVMARQVLEHVPDIALFFKSVDMLLAEDGVVFLDVPEIGVGLEEADCTIVWEEHVNYFTENVLSRLLDRFGFTPVASQKFNYSGGGIAVLGRRKGAKDRFVATQEYHAAARSFKTRVDAYGASLLSTLREKRASFDNIVLYGVGCRACALVNGLGLEKAIDFAVDDQVERQGKFMPGSKLLIRDPKILAEPGRKSLVLLAVNEENEDHVQAKTLAACQNSHVEFLRVFRCKK